jgi:hypothetical protein
VPCAIIAANERWTTFTLLDDIDTASIAALLEAVVMRIDADDDYGSSVFFFGPDGWSAELVVELAPDAPTLTTADRDLLALRPEHSLERCQHASNRRYIRTHSVAAVRRLVLPGDTSVRLVADVERDRLLAPRRPGSGLNRRWRCARSAGCRRSSCRRVATGRPWITRSVLALAHRQRALEHVGDADAGAPVVQHVLDDLDLLVLGEHVERHAGRLQLPSCDG